MTQHPLSDVLIAEYWPDADPADIRRQFDALTSAERREWLIRKNGYFYRPNRAGYTTEKVAAGRYTKAEADREAAIEPENFTVLHESEVPDAPEVESLKAEVAALQSRIEAMTRDMSRNYRGRRLMACQAADDLHRVIDAIGVEDGSTLPLPEGMPAVPAPAIKREMQNGVATLLRLILLHNDGHISPQTLKRF
ncbi:hypothetical protein EOA27_32280 [Mesorhizobium sp. M2A.F.Ca.ET.037.01.1.1]|uniref:hypothetical protein n=1 Tax=Mesorhizobium sp. M2A.F.Ca.ET.037.01.1.1 TaxID=2496748 RepID=UPI000FCC260D|nr:hypothetical protein [Mesorhizobium sp. M2A.F.Ca.ET.037.01.1.1]RUX02345.1 hypothetical protein EOA27_32280 [Mesorhizobium sp. M2A.F.Ca.ET.037.01.1.1]